MDSVFFNDEEYQEILQHLDQLTQEAEQLPYPEAKERITSILKYFDLVHREALSRLMKIIKPQYPELLEKIQADYTTKTLFTLYDLIEGEIAFKKSDSSGSMGFVALEEVRILTPLVQTIWHKGGKESDIQENQLYAKEIGGSNVLIIKNAAKIYALRNACLDSVLPMQFGHLQEQYLICPWHGCKYDISTGELMDRPGEKLETYAVKLENDGTFNIGIKTSTL